MNKVKLILRQLNRPTINNGMWLYLLQVFNTIVPLITLPYITRILGSSKFGIFSIAINLIGYLQVVVEYGFDMSATRKIVLLNNCGRDKEKINKIFSCIVFSRLILFGASIIIVGVYILGFSTTFEQGVCLVILLLTLLGSCFQQNWLFQGMQEMKYISIISILSRIVSVLLIFIFVLNRNDLYLYCVFYSIAPFLNGFISMILAIIKFNLKFTKVNAKDIKDEMKYGWYVFTTQLSSKVFGAIGITFLGIFSDKSTVGIFSAIQKIPTMMMLAWSPISQVLYPISTQKMQQSWIEGKSFVSHYRKIFVSIFALIACIFSLFSKLIIDLFYGVEYSTHSFWVIPLLFWLIVGIDNNFLGIQTLLASGLDKEYSKCFQIGVACTILINFVMIYFFAGLGAAIAPFLSECILGIVLRIVINKYQNLNKL